MRTALGLNSLNMLGISPLQKLIPLAMLAAALSWTQTPPAQTQTAAASTARPHKAVHKHKQTAKTQAEQKTAQPAAPAAPPVALMPQWPANEKPNEATVTWDSQGLRINATNSSLEQILKDVGTVTGATVDGLNGDERIFGAYGPGKARDVLSQLLQGTSYNVLMIGDQGEGTPREIILSARNTSAKSKTVAVASQPSNDDDSDVDDQQQPPPPPGHPGFGPPGMRSPQQDLEQRQQQIQQMQQQQTNNPQ